MNKDKLMEYFAVLSVEERKELIRAFSKAKSDKEISDLAKEKGILLKADDAKALYNKLNTPPELSDEDLDKVAGGLAPAAGIMGDEEDDCM